MSDPNLVKPFGLTQVYSPRGGPTVDIVFVHGLNGHPKESWTSNSGCFWPVDLLPDILAPLRPRILTYGYNANVAAFTDGASRDSIVSHAETLSSNLAANRNLRNGSERPIIFVCHSLGGLVVKRALIYSRNVADEKTEHLRSVYVSTFGILFLGTPHNGSDVAKWGLLLHKICKAVLPKKVMEASPQLIQALRKDNETLQHINSLFANIMSRFHIYLFHETRSTDVKGTREIIVDEASAAPYLEGVERMGIEADHSHMCKFEDENAPGFEVVAEAILRYSRQSPPVIADRWIEERETRALEKKAKAREIYDGRADDPAGRSMPDLNTSGHSVASLPQGPATDGGRSSPVSDMGNSLTFSQSIPKDAPLFVTPPGFHPNATFYGMQKELEVLHNRLFKAKARAVRAMAVLISGVPGSGKTHLARQYVFTQRECYPGGVFWIDAKSRESSFKCFWEIAQTATLIDRKEAEDQEYKQSRSYVNAVRNWLQTRHEWLMVFDGITFDHDEDINEFRAFLPWNKRCSMIYTSVDTTLRKKQRLYEPYCLSMPRLSVEDACKLLFKDLGIKKPTSEQVCKAKELVDHYECLPLAIHAIGHRLNATGKPIEKYRVKYQVTDKKLAEPFLSIMNDLYRLHQRQALNLINLLSFLGHHVPVGLINLGRAAMSAENAEILTSAQAGEDPDLDTTLGTLIHYGLIERTTDASPLSFSSTSAQHSSDEMNADATPTPKIPGLTESMTEGSQDGFFSIYRGASAVDVIKMHSVVQRFCRDELRIKDDECRSALNRQDPGFFDSWLIVATRFLCKSYETAKERMAHYHDCGLVRDYREYETHASRLEGLFPKKSGMSAHPSVLREARDHLRQLMKSISSAIDRMSPSSSQETSRHQKSVFDRSSSSSSSFPDSSADEGISRESTWNWTESDSVRAESPEQMIIPPRFKLDLFPPHIFRQAGYESEDGYETDGEKQAPRISPALSQMSQTTEKPKPSPPSSSPPGSSGNWQFVERHHRTRQKDRQSQPRRQTRGPRRFRGSKSDTPLVKVSSIHGRGSSSRVSTAEGASSSILASAAERALVAVRSSSQPPSSVPTKQENEPTWAIIAAQHTHEAELLPIYSEPGHELLRQPLWDLHTAPGSRLVSRRSSLAHVFEPVRDLSASTPSLLSCQPAGRDLSASTPTLLPNSLPLPYDENITVTAPHHRRVRRRSAVPVFPSSTPKPGSVAHPSAILPGPAPLQQPNDPVLSEIPIIAQQQAVSGAGSRPGDLHLSGSVLQSETLHPAIPPSQPRLASVDERLRDMDLSWNPDAEPAQILQLGAHRVNVRDARNRLHESARLLTPCHVPAYQLYHRTLSGPLIQDDSRIHSPTSTREVYDPHTSPPRPDGLGVEFP